MYAPQQGYPQAQAYVQPVQQPQQEPPKSRIALFPKKPESQGTHVLSYVTNITPQLLQEMLAAAQASGWAVDQYGHLAAVKLSGAIYQNERSLGGLLNLQQPRQTPMQAQYNQYPQQQQYAPAPQPQMAPQQQYAPQPMQQALMPPQQQYIQQQQQPRRGLT